MVADRKETYLYLTRRLSSEFYIFCPESRDSSEYNNNVCFAKYYYIWYTFSLTIVLSTNVDNFLAYEF